MLRSQTGAIDKAWGLVKGAGPEQASAVKCHSPVRPKPSVMEGDFSDETTVRTLAQPQMGVNGGPLSRSAGFVVFEDYFAGIRAKRRFKELRPESAEGSNVPNMWKMDYLEYPGIREMAVEEACNADVVIISISGHEELPPGMRAWLKDWRSNQSRCAAEMLAIVATAETTADPLAHTQDEKVEAAGLNYLRREAESSKLRFSFELARPTTSSFLWLDDD